MIAMEEMSAFPETQMRPISLVPGLHSRIHSADPIADRNLAEIASG
jgi:hypothetical protein